MRYKISQFMVGRNGTDDYARFQSILALIIIILSFIVGRFSTSTGGMYICTLLWVLGIVLVVRCYMRTFSRKLALRRSQNAQYLQKAAKVKGLFAAKKAQFQQRKDFCFFNCPSCKATMRVPKGKGKVKIVCRKCGEAFVRKT